jgi:lysophospholipase L1-like esterase
MIKRKDNEKERDGSITLRSLIQPHPDKRIIFDLIPNQKVKFQGAPVRTNALGMRGDGVSPYKLPLEYRITLLGDSFTFGWGVKEEETFVKILENCLNSSSPSKYHFRVLNLGVPGYSTFQEVAAFKKLVPILKPDLVLLYFVENDFGLPFFLTSTVKGGRS